MKKTSEEYIALRNKFKPGKISFIFLYESPQANGAYFYDFKDVKKDLLFKPLMKLIDFRYNYLNEQVKLKGIKRFQELGYFIVDSVYEPVNTITNAGVRDNIILKNFHGLVNDLKSISADTEETPIILVKTSMFKLLYEKLRSEGFNVINEYISVPNLTESKEERFLRKIMEVFMCQLILANDKLSKYYLPKGIPNEYSVKSKKVKAILLGADPSNFDSSGKTRVSTHVFNIMGSGSASFNRIRGNLTLTGLSKENLYAQNVVRNYMTVEASQNRLWPSFAELWKPLLKEDLDKLDPQKQLPVFVTEECVMNVMLNSDIERQKAAVNYYVQNIIVKPEDNYLERNLIPCFTGNYAYSDFPSFFNEVRKYVKL